MIIPFFSFKLSSKTFFFSLKRSKFSVFQLFTSALFGLSRRKTMIAFVFPIISNPGQRNPINTQPILQWKFTSPSCLWIFYFVFAAGQNLLRAITIIIRRQPLNKRGTYYYNCLSKVWRFVIMFKYVILCSASIMIHIELYLAYCGHLTSKKFTFHKHLFLRTSQFFLFYHQTDGHNRL